MSHTLVAVFDNRSDAQQALEELVSSGFSRQSARLSEGDSSSLSGSSSSLSSNYTDSSVNPGSTINTNINASPNQHSNDGSIGSSIKNFFADVFGSDDDNTRLYSGAVNQGHFVLTLTTDTEPEVERAADIVERYGPIDIDEHSDKWSASGASYSSDALRSSSGSLSQSSSASYQQDSLNSGSQMRAENLSQDSLSTSLSGSQQRAETQTRSNLQDTTAIPVIQESLAVGKREVQRGGVRIYQRVVETPVNESVSLREEHVNVERHAVDRPVSGTDLDAFKEGTIELRESGEEAVVQKTARVVEEVVVGKEVSQRTENISDSVRRTEVEIEQLSAEDDNYYRSHWTSNFGTSGERYEDYEPAYRYGSSTRRSSSYAGRSWDDVEPTLRTDWESRYPGSTWEKIKAAVRHGWDRVTN